MNAVIGTLVFGTVTVILVGLFLNWKSSTSRQPQDRKQDERQAPLQLQPEIKLNLKDFVQQNVFFPIQLQSRESSFEDSTDGSDPVFDGFIQQVISKTENQRKNWQFACLMLRGASETQNQRFTYKPHYSDNSPYVNDSEVFSPPVERLNNYIIARPSNQTHGQKHAEVVILDHFNKLWEAYIKNRKQKPVSVVLFSWIMPCVACTSKLIETLSELGVPVYIAYTIKYHYRETEQQMQNSVINIKKSGMVIEQVDYQDRLPSKRY